MTTAFRAVLLGSGLVWTLLMMSWLKAPCPAPPFPTVVSWKAMLLSSLASGISFSGSTRTSLCMVPTIGWAKTRMMIVALSLPGGGAPK